MLLHWGKPNFLNVTVVAERRHRSAVWLPDNHTLTSPYVSSLLSGSPGRSLKSSGRRWAESITVRFTLNSWVTKVVRHVEIFLAPLTDGGKSAASNIESKGQTGVGWSNPGLVSEFNSERIVRFALCLNWQQTKIMKPKNLICSFSNRKGFRAPKI